MIQSLPVGKMLAVPLSEAEVRPLLGKDLSLSAVNGPFLCAIAGLPDAVDELERQLTESGLACLPIPTSHAFHSQMMDAIALPFIELVKTFNLQPPKIPYLSNVTGTWITASQATGSRIIGRSIYASRCYLQMACKSCGKTEFILLRVSAPDKH